MECKQFDIDKTKVHNINLMYNEITDDPLREYVLKIIQLDKNHLSQLTSVYSMGKKVAAGFVIFRLSKTIEYLLLQTSYGINHWTPPKGHVDPGETDVMVTAFRETLEESGLHEEDLEIYKDCKKILNYQVNGKPKEVHYFLAKLVNPKAEIKLSNEHQDFKWLEIGEACRIVGYEDMQLTLKEFNEYIIKTNNNSSK